jgi:molecular chaperone HscC
MIVGIDLGTTNSLVSAWTDNGITLIPNEFGEYLTPSVVSFDKDGTATVGKIAKERLITDPDTTVCEFKRQMGRDVQYKLGKAGSFSPVDLSAIVIKKLVKDAEAKLGEKVDSAVISVPAYFDDHQREATRVAGLKAGIKVTQLVNEPSAAALSYHVQHMDQDEKFIVFDFGGGTLDVTLVDTFANIVEIRNISGDNALGGKDFNEAIAMDICSKKGLDYQLLGKKNQAILLNTAEAIKIKLTSEDQVNTTVFLEGENIEYQLSRQELINISSSIFKRLTLVLKKLMNDSMLAPDDIAGVIMVGGSSKMPIVRAYMESLYPGKIHVDALGDVAICRGAGIVTGITLRKDDVKDIVMTDICPFSLGVETVGDNMSVIIPKNQTLPTSKTSRYVTVSDMQRHLEFNVYQGEKLKASGNLLLESIKIDIPPMPRGQVYCDVRFSYDLNGIFDIDVFCPANNSSVHRSRGAVEGIDSDKLKEIQLHMDELKQDPYEIPEIKYLLEKAGRMYEEGNELQKRVLESQIRSFRHILDKGNLIDCKKAAVGFSLTVDQIEKTMFSFDVERENLWNEFFEKDLENKNEDDDRA